MTTSSPSTLETDTDDPSLAAQEAFLSTRTRPAAKVVRATRPRERTTEESQASDVDPGWYQQMKGVRFRLDDLEDNSDQPKPQELRPAKKDKDINDRPVGSAVMGDIVEREISTVTPVFTARGTRTSRGFPAPRHFGRPQGVMKTPSASESQFELSNSGDRSEPLEGKALMEEIDRENRKKMAEMSEEEILELQKSLQESLPLGLREKFLHKSESAEPKESSNVPPSSSKLDSPKSTLKARQKEKAQSLDEDDQSFDAHLRTFFPKRTTSVAQPEWTLPVHLA